MTVYYALWLTAGIFFITGILFVAGSNPWSKCAKKLNIAALVFFALALITALIAIWTEVSW